MSKIMIVDDERSIRVPLHAFLFAEGHEVELAEDVGQAHALLSDGVWDVVVTAGLDGYLGKPIGIRELRAEMRRHMEGNPEEPIEQR